MNTKDYTILKEYNSKVKFKMIRAARIMYNDSGVLPTRQEFIDGGHGTDGKIRRNFKLFKNLLVYVNTGLERDKLDFEDDLYDDMGKLTDIMKEFGLNPLRGEDTTIHGNPIDRSIFCNLIADKYPILRNSGEDLMIKVPSGRKSAMTPLSRFLGYAENKQVKYQVQSIRIRSLKGYKDYEKKYKIIKAAFNDNVLYISLKKLQSIRDDAQFQMTGIMNQILAE